MNTEDNLKKEWKEYLYKHFEMKKDMCGRIYIDEAIDRTYTLAKSETLKDVLKDEFKFLQNYIKDWNPYDDSLDKIIIDKRIKLIKQKLKELETKE